MASQPEILREEFDATETRAVVETASAAVAAQATASVQARWLIAQRNQRDWDSVRVKMLRDCGRLSFAQSARYSVPRGAGKVEGYSIRFAEAALRAMGNIMPETLTVYDDKDKRIVRVSVTDLEANLTYSKDVTIPKTVERKAKPREESTILGSRWNSQGERVYIIEATDDDILNKENALVSKAIRTSGLRLLPGDILDECLEVIQRVRREKINADPDAARKSIVDSFAGLNVPPDQLKAYLGHDLGTASPAELDELRGLFAAIREGAVTWSDAMASKAPAESDAEEPQRQERENAFRDRVTAAREKAAAAAREKAGNGAAKAAQAAAPAAAQAEAAPASGNGLPSAVASAIKHRIAGGNLTDAGAAKFERDVILELQLEFKDLPGISGDGAKMKRALAIVQGMKLPGK